MDNKQATPVELSYLAGIIDGEGCIAVQKQQYKTHTGFAVNFKITNSDPNIVEKIQSIYNNMGFNAYIRENSNPDKPQWKTWYDLYFTKRSIIKEVLTQVLPYLVGKQARAKLMLRCIDNLVTPEEAFEQMKIYNRKGESSETTRETPHFVDEDIVQAS